MSALDDFIEQKGAKSFVTLSMIFYVIGTVIFNIYLRSLGIAEFDLVKLRYVFVGFTFSLITAISPFAFIFGRKLWLKWKKRTVSDDDAKTFTRRLEIVLWILLVPWTIAYALYIFPLISSGFGGAKPVIARLIGKAEDIRGINQLIAFETGVPVEKLPFEYATEDSELAIGANVMILDRNNDRIFLLLTKELYLSSTSNLARSLLASGKATKGLETFETKNFKVKPLIVKADKIEGITLSLYEPPELLTSDDIAIAVAAIAASPNDQRQAQIVSDFITEKAPEAAPRVLAAVQKQIERTQQQQAKPKSKPSEEGTVPVEGNEQEVTPTKENQAPATAEELTREFEQIFNTGFLRYRAEVFGQASRLCDAERRTGVSSGARIELAKFVSGGFQSQFPEEWKMLAEKNYLVNGQRDDEYVCRLVRLFQGAESPETVIQRLNETKPQEGADFDQVRTAALYIFNKSSQINTATDRKYVSQVLIKHFNQKAKREAVFWNEPKYFYDGKVDEKYFENIGKVLNESVSWEDLRYRLVELEDDFNARQEEVAPPVEETPEEGEPAVTPSPAEETPPPAGGETSPAETPPPVQE